MGGSLWNVCLSKGDSFDCSSLNIHNGGVNNNIVGDFNGDEKTDLGKYENQGKNWKICLSNGTWV